MEQAGHISLTYKIVSSIILRSGSANTVAVSNLKLVLAVETFTVKHPYDYYWTHIVSEEINRRTSPVINPSRTVTVIKNVHTPDLIAGDWITESNISLDRHR